MDESSQFVVERASKGLNSPSLVCRVVGVDRRSSQIVVSHPTNGDEAPKMFTFDNVFGEDSKQCDLYNETCQALVDSVLSGFNGTIFACLSLLLFSYLILPL